MATWDFFREIDGLRREIDQAFRGIGAGRLLPYPFLAGPAGRFPQINLAEDEHNVYVEALVPGVDPKELEMTVMRNTLTIGGERKPVAPNEKPHVWHRNERGFGKFSRTLELPTDIDTEKVSATCRNGILCVTLAKHEAAKPKRIAVSVS